MPPPGLLVDSVQERNIECNAHKQERKAACGAGRRPVREATLMGRGTRPKPARLAEKLVYIRRALSLSQNGLIKHLRETDDLIREDISEFERGRREPPLPVLLKYARAAGVPMDVLVDDELDLPQKVPARQKKAK
jgi:hypothetical protein